MTTPDDAPLRRVRPDEDLSSVFGTHQPAPGAADPGVSASAADAADDRAQRGETDVASSPRPLADAVDAGAGAGARAGAEAGAEHGADAHAATPDDADRGAREAAVTAGPPTNPVGRWAFIVSIVAAVIALIPMPNFSIALSFAPAVVAVVLGVAGLCLRGRPWGFAVLGILIAVASVAASVVLTYAYLGGFDTEAAGVRPGF